MRVTLLFSCFLALKFLLLQVHGVSGLRFMVFCGKANQIEEGGLCILKRRERSDQNPIRLIVLCLRCFLYL